jgi:hypothetical protein
VTMRQSADGLAMAMVGGQALGVVSLGVWLRCRPRLHHTPFHNGQVLGFRVLPAVFAY